MSSNGSEKDIHESNAEYLRKSYDTALEVADYLGWKVVNCVNDAGELKSIEQIHNEIYEIVCGVFSL
jgi:dTMP kinase